MEYKLAKELKDAGFPQGQTCGFENNASHHSGPNCCTDPTLSDLIEACGPKFGSLEKCDKEANYTPEEAYPPLWQWAANSKTFWGIRAFGSTPEEAVALLWLALNKK